MPQPPRLFAVVPAAGLSRRMQRPKLLLPLGAKTVITRLLDALDRPDVVETFVVARCDDQPLHEEVEHTTATLVLPEIDPPDMRASVEYALREIRWKRNPQPEDGWLLTPADHPVLETGIFDELIGRWLRGEDPILVPTCDGKRGHPTFFRWKLAEEVASLPADRGINEILKRHAREVVEFPLENPAVLIDLDTPEDYETLRRRWQKG